MSWVVNIFCLSNFALKEKKFALKSNKACVLIQKKKPYKATIFALKSNKTCVLVKLCTKKQHNLSFKTTRLVYLSMLPLKATNFALCTYQIVP